MLKYTELKYCGRDFHDLTRNDCLDIIAIAKSKLRDFDELDAHRAKIAKELADERRSEAGAINAVLGGA